MCLFSRVHSADVVATHSFYLLFTEPRNSVACTQLWSRRGWGGCVLLLCVVTRGLLGDGRCVFTYLPVLLGADIAGAGALSGGAAAPGSAVGLPPLSPSLALCSFPLMLQPVTCWDLLSVFISAFMVPISSGPFSALLILVQDLLLLRTPYDPTFPPVLRPFWFSDFFSSTALFCSFVRGAVYPLRLLNFWFP